MANRALSTSSLATLDQNSLQAASTVSAATRSSSGITPFSTLHSSGLVSPPLHSLGWTAINWDDQKKQYPFGSAEHGYRNDRKILAYFYSRDGAVTPELVSYVYPRKRLTYVMESGNLYSFIYLLPWLGS